MSDSLHKPSKSTELEDPGATGVAGKFHPGFASHLTIADQSDDSSDQFTDASEGRKPGPSASSERLPVPVTRVERLDDTPAYGEVPGTAAYNMRARDAVPDEVEVVTRSRSASRVNTADRPATGSGPPPVPKIVAIKIDPDVPAYGDVPGTEAFEKRKADAVPDVVLRSPAGERAPDNPFAGSPTVSSRSPSAIPRPLPQLDAESTGTPVTDDGGEDEDDGFGDDFDEFEEGQEGGDFGEFEVFQNEAAEELSEVASSVPAVATPSIPLLDWSDVDDVHDLETKLDPYISQLFPDAELATQIESPSLPPQTFLSDRSLSLYSQLVAPPPLAPPNWLRSRIRRLFLVSLGVPVDLDEILPASKQKKLVLPSINIAEKSPRGSTDSRGPNGVSRLKAQNDSSVSVDSSGNRKGKRRKDEAALPDLDIGEALRAGRTTEVRLEGMSDEELTKHVERLKALEAKAKEALAFWEQKREGATKEKEAFEGVIENLVKHARKVRK